jgi:hypothetical protein
MKRIVILLLLVLLIASAAAFAQKPPEFSADMQMKSPEMRETVTGKIYFAANKTRMDMRAQGHESHIITDMQAKKTYMVMPEARMYMEYDYGKMRDQVPDVKPRSLTNPCAGDDTFSCAKVGSETVNGRSCDKWRFTSRKKDTPSMTAWLDQKSMVPIRSLTDDGNQFDLLNFREGAQDPGLFAIPSGYTKMDMGGLMGGEMPRPRR